MDRREALNGDAEPFLARWSRRKQEAREPGKTGPEAEPAAEVDPAAAAPAPEAELQPEPEPKVLTDEDMPPIESLTDDADYSGFLSPGVSELLRRQALKRLFSSPKFNVTDGLDDFAEDYTQFAPLGDVVTADMKHQMARLLEKLGSGDADDGKPRVTAEAAGRGSPAPVEDVGQAPSNDVAVTDQDAKDHEPQRREGAEGVLVDSIPTEPALVIPAKAEIHRN